MEQQEENFEFVGTHSRSSLLVSLYIFVNLRPPYRDVAKFWQDSSYRIPQDDLRAIVEVQLFYLLRYHYSATSQKASILYAEPSLH